MAMQWLREFWTWWASLPRDTVFFLSIPFIVAAAGLLANEYHRRRA